MYQRKDGRWHKIVSVNGRRKDFYSTAATKKKAERDIELQLIEYNVKEEYERHNFKILADKMLEEKEPLISYNTYQCYKYSLQRLSPFYEMNIEDVTPSMLQNILDDLARKQYGKSAIHKTKVTFGLIFDYAIRQGLSVTNFVRSVKLPKTPPTPKISTPDDDVIRVITSSVKTATFGLWALTLLCTGLRRGELAALTVGDIDFSRNVISVKRSVEFIGNTPHVKDAPKTASGVRRVPIIDLLREPLFEHCKTLPPDYFVFGGQEPYLASTIVNEWKKYQKAIGVKVNQHQLRHAYAKLLYRSGVDVKTAQGLLGHKNFQVTMDIYTEFDKELTASSSDKLNDLINKIL